MSEPTEQRVLGIYRETVDELYGYVSRRCGGDRALAEDVVQETWLRAVRSWQDGIPDRPLAWLRTVARNLLLNHYRTRQPLALDSLTSADALAVVDSAEVTESTDVAAVVTQALSRLPSGQARLLEAFHFERRRVSQIAAKLGISERAVEGRLRRARQSLRREVIELIGATGDST